MQSLKKRNKYNSKCEVLYLKFYAESTFVGSKKKKSNVNDVVASFQSFFFYLLALAFFSNYNANIFYTLKMGLVSCYFYYDINSVV